MTTTTDLHPTSAEPECCHVCGRRAIGIALPGGRRDDHRWLCAECYPLLEYVKSVRHWDAYECKAVIYAIESVGATLEAIGKTDLAEMDDLEAKQLATAFARGHQDGIRRALKEGPF